MLNCYTLSNNGLTTFSLEEIDFPTGSAQFNFVLYIFFKARTYYFLKQP